MNNQFITTSSIQTKKLGAMLAEELRGSEIICLSGDLGAGKTTFTQGLLKGLKIKGPYTSPTFLIIKNYKKEFTISKSQFLRPRRTSLGLENKSKISNSKIKNIYHIDAYRVGTDDILNLGWQDFAGKPDSIVIVEWPQRIKKIIPTSAVWINFEWISDKERKITLKN